MHTKFPDSTYINFPFSRHGAADAAYIGWVKEVPLYSFSGAKLKEALAAEVQKSETTYNLEATDYERCARNMLNVILDPLANSTTSDSLCCPFLLVEYKRDGDDNTSKDHDETQLFMYMASVVDMGYLLGFPPDEFVVFGLLGSVKDAKVMLYAMNL